MRRLRGVYVWISQGSGEGCAIGGSCGYSAWWISGYDALVLGNADDEFERDPS